jgi:hypothetical protein
MFSVSRISDRLSKTMFLYILVFFFSLLLLFLLQLLEFHAVLPKDLFRFSNNFDAPIN